MVVAFSQGGSFYWSNRVSRCLLPSPRALLRVAVRGSCCRARGSNEGYSWLPWADMGTRVDSPDRPATALQVAPNAGHARAQALVRALSTLDRIRASGHHGLQPRRTACAAIRATNPVFDAL